MSLDLTSQESAIATDAFGVTHVVWADGGYLWHAIYDENAGAWRHALAVTYIGAEPVKGLNLVTSPVLIHQSGSASDLAPGLAVVFHQGKADDSDFFYTAAQYTENGNLQWLDTPISLTSDQVADLKPDAIVYDGGTTGPQVIVTGTKVSLANAANMAVTEDTDIYTQQFTVESNLFTNASASMAPSSTPAPYSPQTTVNGVVNTGILSTSASPAPAAAAVAANSPEESTSSLMSAQSTSSDTTDSTEPSTSSSYQGLGGSWGAQLAFDSNLLRDWKLLDTTPDSSFLKSIIKPFLKEVRIVGVLSAGETFSRELFLDTNATVKVENEKWGHLWGNDKNRDTGFIFSALMDSNYSFASAYPYDLEEIEDTLSLTFGISVPIVPVTETGVFKLNAIGSVGVNFEMTASPTASGGSYWPQTFFPALAEVGGVSVADGVMLGIAGLTQDSGSGGNAVAGLAVASIGLSIAETLSAYINGATSGLALSGVIAAPVISGSVEGIASPFLLFGLLSEDNGIEHESNGTQTGKKVPPLSINISAGVEAALNWGVINDSSGFFTLGVPVDATLEIWGPLQFGVSIDPSWKWMMYDGNSNEATTSETATSASAAGNDTVNGSTAGRPGASVSGALLTVDMGVACNRLPDPGDFTVTITNADGTSSSVPVFDVLAGETPTSLILRLEQSIPAGQNFDYTASSTPVVSNRPITLSFSNHKGVTDTGGNLIPDMGSTNTSDPAPLAVTNNSPLNYSVRYNPTSGNSSNYIYPTLELNFNTVLDPSSVTTANFAAQFQVTQAGTADPISPSGIRITPSAIILEFDASIRNSQLQNVSISYQPPAAGGLTDSQGHAIAGFSVNNGFAATVSQSTVYITDSNPDISLGSDTADYTVTVTDADGNPLSGIGITVVEVDNINGSTVLTLSAPIDPSSSANGVNAVILYNDGSASATISSMVTGLAPPVVTTQAALGNIEADLGQDSPPALALTASGDILATWITEVPPITPIAGFIYAPDVADGDYTLVVDFIDALGNNAINPPIYPAASQFVITETTTGMSFNLDSNRGTNGMDIHGNTLTFYLDPLSTAGFSLPANPHFTLEYSLNPAGSPGNLFFFDATDTQVWVDSFTLAMDNQIGTTTAPSIQKAGAVATSSATSEIVLIFNQVLSVYPAPASSDFTIESNGTAYAVTGLTVDGNTVNLTVSTPAGSSPIGTGDIVTVSYSGTDLRNANGAVPVFTDQPVITAASNPTTVLKYGFGPSGSAMLGSLGTIPGSDGINFYPAVALDQNRNNVLVWSHADMSQIDTSLTPGEFYTEDQANIINDALGSSEILYAIYNKTTQQWSAAAPLDGSNTLGGADGTIALGTGPDGNLMAAWLNQNTDGSNSEPVSQIYWSQLTYSPSGTPLWSTPAVLYTDASPDPLTELVVGSVGAQPAVFWTQTQPYSYSEITQKETPLLYFRLAETAGTTLVNEGIWGAAGNGIYQASQNTQVSFGQNGALENISTHTGDPNPAVLFNAGTSATLPNGIDTYGNAFSIEFWFKVDDLPSSGNTVDLVSLQGLGSLGLTGNTLTYNINGQTLLPPAGTPAIVAGTWNYVVGTYDSESSTATLYLNGIPVASQGALSFTAPTSTNIILAGTGNTSAVFLDEVAFYNKALSYNDTPSENGMTGGYEAIASLLNDAAIGEKYDSQYVAPLNPGPDTRYVVFDTATGIWGQQASIQPTADPVATELADFNSPAWDVVSSIPANANGTVAPNGVTDIYLPLTLQTQATGQSITALSVSANGTTWSLLGGGQQLGLLQNGQLLNPLNPSDSLDYVIKSATVNLGLLIDPGTSGVTSQSQFTLSITIDGVTTSQIVDPIDDSITSSATTVSGTAVVTEANDSSLALIDSGFVINTTNNAMGYTLASADFNGDGLSDVAVGNSGYTNLYGTTLGQGSIQVLFGIDDPVDGTAPAGVLNDNESNPLTTNNLSGNPGGLLITGIPDNGVANGNFPLSLTTGDINGDGYADLIVGSPNANSFTGAVYCIFGGSTLANQTIDVSGWTSETSSSSGYMLTGNAPGDGFGFAVAAGNFDGNNLADIAIGAPGVNNGQGAVYVALDGAKNPGAVYTSANSGELAGYAVAISSADASTSALSFTGNNSTDDLLIGAPGHVVNVTNHWTNLSSLPANTNQRNDYPSTSPAKAGAVYVFASTAPSSGTTATLATTFTSSPTQSYLGPNLPSSANGTASDTMAGSALASADWNGDGTNDLALSAPGGSNGDGSIYVINGASSGGTAENIYLNTLSTLEIVGGLPGSATGTVITNAGDVNADGYQDLLITAPQGANGTGQSYVVFGPLMPDGRLDLNVTASDNKSTFLLNGSLPNQLTGTAAAAIGDINNDNVDDLMITAPNAAQLYAVYGHPWLADDGSIKLANLSGDNGFVVDGQLYQVPTADGMMPLSDNGLNVAVLGDVNGDGYADVLSGGDTAGQLIIFGNSTQDLLDAAADTDDLLVTGSGYTALDDVMPMADINGDGYKDFGVIAGGSFGVVPGSPYLGAGATLVVSPSIQVNGTAVTSASSAGDFNGDGYDDLLLTGAGGTDFYLGNSTATLASPVSINTQGNTVFQGIGDVNGDGYDDIAGGNPDDNGQATIYYGNASALIGSTASPAPVLLSPPTASTSGSLNNADWTFYSSQASNLNPSWSGQETDIAPSFAVYNGYLYMLYNSNDNNHLWMQRSADGYTWEGLTDLGTGFETYAQASLGVFNDTLYLAFTGTNNEVLLSAATLTDDDLGVSFSTSGTFFQVGGQTANSGPTLVTYDGYL